MSNICEQCGGVKTFSIKIQPVYSYANDGTKEMLPASIPFKICMCPLPREKHDGKLDDYQNGYNECRVSRIDNVSFLVMEESDNHLISVPGILLDGVADMMSLTAKQALSLLAWLRQEETALERLAKEQAE